MFNIYIFLHPETSIMHSRRSQSQLLLHPLPFDCCSVIRSGPRAQAIARPRTMRARGLQRAIHRQQLIKLLRDLVAGCEPSCATHARAHGARCIPPVSPPPALRARQLAPRVRIRARDVSRYARARARGHSACNAHTHVVR